AGSSPAPATESPARAGLFSLDTTVLCGNMQQGALQRYVNLLLAVVLTVVVLHYGQRLLLVLIVPSILAFLLLPFVRMLEGRGVPRWLASTLASFSAILVVAGVIGFLGARFMSFRDELPQLQEKLDGRIDKAQEFVADHLSISTGEQVVWIEDQVRNLGEAGGKLAVDLFSWTGAFLSDVVLIGIILILMLMYRDRFRQFLDAISEGKEVSALEIVDRIAELTRHYLRGVGLVILILAVLNSVGFLIIGLKHAVLLGITAALLTIIPYIGTLIGGVLPLAVAFLTKDSLAYPLAVLGVVGLAQFLEGNFITPKVVGSSVSLNPLASIVALVAGGMVWGIAGMVLAIPLTGMFKVVCDAVPQLNPYGYLLGEKTDRKWRS
ncbi:MAG TPA: AI-2E family transporter, partial [Flavobacteriales bacterium]|nr:AI-2E family transporter [Flavobacteriales bacterium]